MQDAAELPWESSVMKYGRVCANCPLKMLGTECQTIWFCCDPLLKLTVDVTANRD